MIITPQIAAGLFALAGAGFWLSSALTVDLADIPLVIDHESVPQRRAACGSLYDTSLGHVPGPHEKSSIISPALGKLPFLLSKKLIEPRSSAAYLQHVS